MEWCWTEPSHVQSDHSSGPSFPSVSHPHPHPHSSWTSACWFCKKTDFCEWLLERRERDPRFLRNVLIGDEAVFAMNGEVNTHNVVHYAPAGQPPVFNFETKTVWQWRDHRSIFLWAKCQWSVLILSSNDQQGGCATDRDPLLATAKWNVPLCVVGSRWCTSPSSHRCSKSPPITLSRTRDCYEPPRWMAPKVTRPHPLRLLFVGSFEEQSFTPPHNMQDLRERIHRDVDSLRQDPRTVGRAGPWKVISDSLCPTSNILTIEVPLWIFYKKYFVNMQTRQKHRFWNGPMTRNRRLFSLALNRNTIYEATWRGHWVFSSTRSNLGLCSW